jgi:hypothetical protein
VRQFDCIQLKHGCRRWRELDGNGFEAEWVFLRYTNFEVEAVSASVRQRHGAFPSNGTALYTMPVASTLPGGAMKH